MNIEDTASSSIYDKGLDTEELDKTIDLDIDPRRYNDWEIKEHKKGGQFKWDSAKVDLFLHDKQLVGGITGKKLRKKIAHIETFNVNLLDYLLANPSLIPDNWKVDENGETCYIFFWGTVYYRPSDQGLYVRCLYFNVGKWREDYRSIDYPWSANRFAIIHKGGTPV
jgi:hypothetical protein